jgi:RNA polymerase sigma-70 factor (ECF subfamily)
LQVLPEERRRLLLLIALDGLSYRDVARLLGMPVGTVMSRLSRTRDALRRLMDEEESCNDDRRLAEGHRGGRGKEREGFNAAAAE